jgi:hypothetical protein
MKRSAAFSSYPVTAFGGSMLCVPVAGTIKRGGSQRERP